MAHIAEAQPRVLTVEEVAERLRVDSRTVYDLIRRRELHARKVGRVWRVPSEALDRYLMEDSDHEYDNEPFSAEDLAAIRRGLADIKAGRTVSRAELNSKYGL